MKIGLLTAGGLAPCLSASIGNLIGKYYDISPDIEIIGYLNGYKGLLMGNSIQINENVKKNAVILNTFGGSPIGNSRVKLTNIKDCINKGYIKNGEIPLEVASRQLLDDGVNILHTIGGDDTNTMAAELSKHLADNGHDLIVVGLPKTVDNDVYPIHQSLGAWTAAEQGAIFFNNIVNENTTSSRQLIIHEVMGRNCGWLTAATAYEYRQKLNNRIFLPDILVSKDRWDIDAVYIPEMTVDIPLESKRLKKIMDKKDSVNIFLSEGAGADSIVRDMKSKGLEIEIDSFGHYRLDQINPGKWFGEQFANMIGAEKVLIQKSGYFARSAAPNQKDLELIKKSALLAVECALNGTSGVIGLDEDSNNELKCIDFVKIKGGKPFNIKNEWFTAMLRNIGQIGY
ncbi:MAG: pyrophosphate--fructose-6-phosphate 1-phosphotransferase [Candidatus Marinimicrobia bacterium]|jgi:pyrophosphate--fructose-6-phosphate 1-phosphotransferase|nr:pyrophosphate--fructose-6-phosphate 1-phosphotransferase [Candidatus Neomarinimicrobiota bacterium]MBT3633688.1 pyrophosphate--fructose-6-phosphate 1-phosphotransferase [Candidatus Neomarinimicrobiota bacterium]MBT3682359.1 pyrophosphate--fructose-6-phosphate 1-phosphotransferase [Candidatus Neomarinimicrobiota bacterium]MBT3759123.1 pyrophosphate--fructose-6-phosphate 1-phosphotransferase [Candidatus Neomarinimicrobiota bacterium]MBT3895604.1 pyrophosphate--fructose-6-phosphate 1-phosphotra